MSVAIASMKSSIPYLIVAVFLAIVRKALSDTNLKQSLISAAHKYAWDQGTEVDSDALARGFCFSPSDQSQGKQTCQSLSTGVHTLMGISPH